MRLNTPCADVAVSTSERGLGEWFTYAPGVGHVKDGARRSGEGVEVVEAADVGV